MAGHSKWANIKRRKGAQDAKRGKLFTRLLREITVAARAGGGDPDGNPRLRAAIQECKGSNVPNDKIDRAIKKGTGELEGEALEEVTYEGYAAGGVAVMVEAVTDNRNRTVGEVRHLFNKHGGNLGQDGSVGYLFNQKGYFQVEADDLDEEAFMEMALELDVDDISTDGVFEMFTEPGDYLRVKQELQDKGVAHESQLARVPTTSVELDESSLPKVLRLVEAMEDLDDVQNVWANFDADDSLLEAHSG